MLRPRLFRLLAFLALSGSWSLGQELGVVPAIVVPESSANAAAAPVPVPAAPPAPYVPKEPPPKDSPEVQAKAVIVFDPESGHVLYEKNADEKRPVASTQKLLTALIIVEKGDLQTEVKIEKTDTKVDPSRIGLKVGKNYPREMLLRGLLVKSGNDSARALARDYSGNQEDFAKVMNKRARAMGMKDSHFLNANGLPIEGQYSTARDMANLAYHVYRVEFLREVVRTPRLDFKHPDGKIDKLDNTNELLKRLPFITGMKTGTTDLAGKCLICSGNYEGHSAIAVVLGSTEKAIWADSESLMRWSLQVPADFPEPKPVPPPKPAQVAKNTKKGKKAR